MIGGADEVGMGPLSGPLAVAVTIIDVKIPGVRDSKQLTEGTRFMLEGMIKDKAKFVHVAHRTSKDIDARGLEVCWAECQRECYQKAKAFDPDVEVWADWAPYADSGKLQKYLKGIKFKKEGDDTIYEIAAASILAKTWRDRQMIRLHQKYPMYDWEKNKGYGTEAHWRAIRKHGMSPHHRAAAMKAKRKFDKRGGKPPKEAESFDRKKAEQIMNEVRHFVGQPWMGEWENGFLDSIFGRLDAGAELSPRQMYFLLKTARKVKRQALRRGGGNERSGDS